MARLDPAQRARWKEALRKPSPAWVGCGLDSAVPELSARLEGMPGLIDWAAHGQVSGLLARGLLAVDECCLIPGDPALQRPSFLFLHHSSKSDPKEFAERAKKLGLSEIRLAETTFPEDFLAKLKQTLKKDGIRCMRLEPEE